MISIGMDPNIFSVGSFTLAWHGLMTGIGVVAAVIVLAMLARKSPRVSMEDVYSSAIWAILGGVVGARLFHVIDHWSDIYSANAWQTFRFWEGGLSLWGALVGGFAVGAAYCFIRKLPVGHLADLAAPGVLLAQAIGRIGCTINGDAYGTPTSLSWGVVYTHPNAAATTLMDGIPRHPAPVYEIIYDLVLFGILWRLRGQLRNDWSLFLLWASSYGLGRFLISFIRGDERPILGSLHQAQVIALAVMVVAIPLFLWTIRTPAAEPAQTAQGKNSPSNNQGNP